MRVQQRAAKRGGGWNRITLAGVDNGQSAEELIDVLDLEDALKRLGELAPRQERIIEMRFYAGLTVEEVAQVLDLSQRTVLNDWRMARAWLQSSIGRQGDIDHVAGSRATAGIVPRRLRPAGTPTKCHVDEHCADDPELRRELKLLLRRDARKNGIFADDNITDGIQFQFDTVVESELPKHIGRYRVKRVLGEGGMGVVYLAEQQNPCRDVAVKVIRSGMVSPDLLKRFELEAAVLGRLMHPGIASIYEAGVFVDSSTGQERPFLAMEYIEGQPLREFVQQLDPATA